MDDPIHQSAGMLYQEDDSLTEALLHEHGAEDRAAEYRAEHRHE